MHDEPRKHVLAEVAAERKTLTAQLRSHQKLEKEVAKEDQKLGDKYWKLASRDFDKEPDDKEREAERLANAAHKRLAGVFASISVVKDKLAALDNDAEIERRVTQRASTMERIDGLKARTGGTDVPTATRKRKTTRVEVPADVIARIVRDVKGGMGITTVTDDLNAEKVKSATGGTWYPKQVWNVVLAKTGMTVSELRKDKPLKSKAVASNPPRRTQTLPKKTVAAKPLSKTAQANGTSRGGTGSKKRKPSAATRKVAASRKRK